MGSNLKASMMSVLFIIEPWPNLQIVEMASSILTYLTEYSALSMRSFMLI